MACPPQAIGCYMLPFALGNFLGPLLLGPLFDTVGRRPMIAFTYAISGVLLALTGGAVSRGVLDAVTLTIVLVASSFFFASAAASSAYLTVSESFPARGARAGDRALLRGRDRRSAASPRRGCSACWSAPASAARSAAATLFGAALMCRRRGRALARGAAERRSLEDVARPLSSAD